MNKRYSIVLFSAIFALSACKNSPADDSMSTTATPTNTAIVTTPPTATIVPSATTTETPTVSPSLIVSEVPTASPELTPTAEPTPPVAQETVTLHTFRKQEQALWQAISNRNLVDGVRIEVVSMPVDDYEQQVEQLLLDNQVDLFTAKIGNEWFDPLVEQGLLTSIQQLGISLDNSNGIYGTLDSKGIAYAVPNILQLQSVIYNKAMLNELGFNEVPRTVAEFDQLMNAATNSGKTGLALDGVHTWYLDQVANEVLFAGWISDITQQQLISGDTCFTNEEVQTAFSRAQPLLPFSNSPATTKYGGKEHPGMRLVVVNGNAVAMIDGSWTTGVWISKATGGLYDVDPNFEPLFGPMPGPNNKVVAFPDGGYAVAANSLNHANITKVLQFATSKQFAELFLEFIPGEIPPYSGQVEIPATIHSIEAARFAELNNASRHILFLEPSLNSGTPKYSDLAADAWQGLIHGHFSPQQATLHIQAGLNSWGYAGAQKCPAAGGQVAATELLPGTYHAQGWVPKSLDSATVQDIYLHVSEDLILTFVNRHGFCNDQVALGQIHHIAEGNFSSNGNTEANARVYRELGELDLRLEWLGNESGVMTLKPSGGFFSASSIMDEDICQ